MKTTTLKAAAAFGLGALLMGSAAAQESVSKPVGYETITIDQQFNYMGLRLLGAPLATSTVATAANDEITLDSGTVADGSVILEVVDGDAAGAVVEATATGGSIAVPAGLLDNLEVGDTVTARAPQTLAGVFGDPVDGSVNGATTGLDGGPNSGAADLILVPDGFSGFDTYWYSTGGLGGVGAGWKQLDVTTNQSSDVADASAINLVYTDGVIIQNRNDNNSIVVSGSVKTTPTVQTLIPSFNYLSTLYPAGTTLSTAFDDPQNPGVLASGSISGGPNFGAADLVLVPDGGGFKTYWYSTGGLGGAGAGWKELDIATNSSTNVTSSDILLDDVSSIIIQNKGDMKGVAVAPPEFYGQL